MPASLATAAGTAAKPTDTGTPSTVLSDAQAAARLWFLEQRLDDGPLTAAGLGMELDGTLHGNLRVARRLG